MYNSCNIKRLENDYGSSKGWVFASTLIECCMCQEEDRARNM